MYFKDRMPNVFKLCLHVVILLVLCNEVYCDDLSNAETNKGKHGPNQQNETPVNARVITNIGKPGMLFYNLESTNTARIEYTIKCISLDTRYTLGVLTTNQDVAVVRENGSFNVSCTNAKSLPTTQSAVEVVSLDVPGPHQKDGATTDTATAANGDAGYASAGVDQNGDAAPNPETSKYVGVVSGNFNVTIKARNIGRAFFVVIAKAHEKNNGPESLKMVSSENAMERSENIHMMNTSNSFSEDNQDMKIGVLSGNDIGVTTKKGRSGQPNKSPFAGRRLHKDQVGLGMIIVMQLPRTIDFVFRWVLVGVIVLATAGMGLKVDVKVVMQVLKKPVGPIIGLVCQFLFMPLIAYAVARTVPQSNAAISLGIFACGTVPGGGVSNMFCYLLDGDVSLSVTMTTLSNVAALAMTPIWIFTLGSTFKDDTIELTVPYLQILEKLAYVIVPLFVGIFIQIKLPKVEKLISKVLKPVIFVMVAGVITLGVYTNMHVFKMIRPMVILAGCLLPYCGYIVGGIISLLCCQTWRRVKTIAIETGIQNTGIAFLMLYLSLPPPDNQLAAVGPAASAIMTPQPLFIIVIIYLIYKRCTNKSGSNDETEDENVGEKTPGAESEPKVKELLSSSKEKRRQNSSDNKCIAFFNETKGKPAFMVLWEKLTGNEQPDLVAEMLNHEMTVPFTPSPTDDKSELWSDNGWDRNANRHY